MNQGNNSSSPLVSVCCITYNHAPYIRQCLDSILMQQTNFRYEIIINDDCSTDGTTEILREYEAKYPIVKPIYQIENQVSKGLRAVFCTLVFPHAKGKYIAMCEGDDYWTDPLKLQKQVDFMEAHPDHSMCFHAIRQSFTDGTSRNIHRYDKDMNICPVEDMINHGTGFCHINSLMINRQRYGDGFSSWLPDTYVEDTPIILHCYGVGGVGYINDVMSVYCYALPGSWSSTRLNNWCFRLYTLRRRINIFRTFDGWTRGRYHSVIKRQIRKSYRLALLAELRNIKRKMMLTIV